MIGQDCWDSDCELLAVAVPGPPGPPGGGGGASDHIEITGIAAQALSGHRAVYRRPDGLIDYADAGTAAHISVQIGVTNGAAASGAAVTVTMLGEIFEGSWTWTTPGLIFLGANGALTQVVPAAPGSDFLAVLGYAVSPTRMYVVRQPSIDLT